MRETRIALLLVLAVLATMPGNSRAPHNSGGTTDTGLLGTMHDLVIDQSRGRLYLTDDPDFGGAQPPGVVVINLTTHQELARIQMSSATGLALSPSGALLAVGTSDGELRLIDVDTLAVTATGRFTDPPYSAYLWNLDFDGEDRLVASLGIQYVSCEGSVIVVNLTSMSLESRLSQPPCGIGPFSRIAVDEPGRRLYIIGGGSASVYDLAASPPVRLLWKQDTAFTNAGVLSGDGRRLYAASGGVYDAASLTLLFTTNGTGEPGLDEPGGFVYYNPRDTPYGQVSRIYQVRLSDGSVRGELRFRGASDYYPMAVHSIALDFSNRVLYALSTFASNANALRAIPLAAAFLDPYPADGSLMPGEIGGTNVIVNGGMRLETIVLTIDGQQVAHGYDPQTSTVSYLQTPPWRRGTHQVSITGQDGSGGIHALTWSFIVDASAPEIYLDHPREGYHERHVIVRGRILDDTFLEATVNREPLTVDPRSGAFQFPLDLNEDVTTVWIVARDRAGHENSTNFAIRYSPKAPAFVLLAPPLFAGLVALALVLLLRRSARWAPPDPGTKRLTTKGTQSSGAHTPTGADDRPIAEQTEESPPRSP